VRENEDSPSCYYLVSQLLSLSLSIVFLFVSFCCVCARPGRTVGRFPPSSLPCNFCVTRRRRPSFVAWLEGRYTPTIVPAITRIRRLLSLTSLPVCFPAVLSLRPVQPQSFLIDTMASTSTPLAMLPTNSVTEHTVNDSPLKIMIKVPPTHLLASGQKNSSAALEGVSTPAPARLFSPRSQTAALALSAFALRKNSNNENSVHSPNDTSASSSNSTTPEIPVPAQMQSFRPSYGGMPPGMANNYPPHHHPQGRWWPNPPMMAAPPHGGSYYAMPPHGPHGGRFAPYPGQVRVVLSYSVPSLESVRTDHPNSRFPFFLLYSSCSTLTWHPTPS
jgi:hypothetical protein